MRLTEISIRNLPSPPNGAKIHHDDTLTGFGVRVTSTGVKSFVLTYGADRERVTLGRYPIIGLADARVEAKRILAERTLNKHRPARLRASDAFDRFLIEKEARNKASTLKITTALIRNHFPNLLEKQLEDITTDDITKITDKLLKKGQPGAAAHAHTAFRTFLRWCVKRRYLQHSPVEGLDKPGRDKPRERVLSDDELRTVWRAAEKTGGTFGDIVNLLILTGQRRSEIGSLHADYIRDDTICLPSATTKNKRMHLFPIGAMANFRLRSLVVSARQNNGEFLFPARGKQESSFNGWSKAKLALDKEIQKGRDEPVSPWTLHDLRRTYATNLQRLGIKLEVIEALLNHVSGTRAGIVGVYNRHRFADEMADAVTAYEEWFAKTLART